FLIGYLQIYVFQALSFHNWAVEVRGRELVAAANFRSFWALIWFLLVYQFSPASGVARCLPNPPRSWSPLFVSFISPALILWGLYCANMLGSTEAATIEVYTSEDALVRSFPFMMLVAAVLLVITGQTMTSSRWYFLAAGLLTGAAYIVVWMFNGKRSH